MTYHPQKIAVANDLSAPLRTDAAEAPPNARASTNDNQAAFSLKDGNLSIAFKSKTDIHCGDSVDLYAGDYYLGAAPVQVRPDTHELFCNAALHHAPSIQFPASVRAVVLRLNLEILPGLTIPSLKALQASMGRHGLEVHLAYAQDKALGFNVHVNCLPVFPRSLTLHLGGRAPVTGLSQLPTYTDSPDSLVHEVIFPLDGPVREGMSVEIVEDATGSLVYETTLTWMNLINPVLVELRNMHQQQEAMTRQLDGMRKQILASADPGRERLMLQRIDLTYLLINERLDREVKWLSSRIEDAAGEAFIPEARLECLETSVQISPSGLQGVGIYDSESNGVDAWRWFSRTVTLFLTQVSFGARTLRFRFTSPGRELDFSRMSISANGYDVPFEWAHPDGRTDLLVGLSSLLSRPDRTLIVTIDFGQAWNAENDSRILTLACLGLDIEA